MSKLNENLSHKDMEGLIKPTVHVDEFSSKIADDADISVISFYVQGREVAQDLVEFLERGYDFILDADLSPGEIKPNRYLVYAEISRRTKLPEQIYRICEDLGTLGELTIPDWEIRFREKTMPCDIEAMSKYLILSPSDYREFDEQLKQLQDHAGITPMSKKNKNSDIRDYVALAGL
jgi:hypothetical protein